MTKVTEAAEAAKTEPQASRSSVAEVELRDEQNQPIGVKVRLGEPAEGTEGTERLASAIEGWSRLVVDGETYTFSRARASLLLSRFSHFREQIAAAVK